MEKANAILRHPLFVLEFEKLRKHEENREFCKHDMVHLLDVARIAYILFLELKSDYQKVKSNTAKELIYAAAYLHDIGRARQYIDGTPHEKESARFAEVILPECGFAADDSDIIIDAILSHRTSCGEKSGFAGLIYRADKLSRSCFACKAVQQCDWELKNTEIFY